MKSRPKKKFFQRPTLKDMNALQQFFFTGTLTEVIDKIEGLADDQTLVLGTDILENVAPHRYEKHAPLATVSNTYNAKQLANPKYMDLHKALTQSLPEELSPVEYIRTAFQTPSRPLGGYAWSVAGESTIKHVPLVELIEGARMFWYERNKMHEKNFEAVNVYHGTPLIRKEGGKASIHVRSETTRTDPYKIVLTGIPLSSETPWQLISSMHACNDKQHTQLRFMHNGNPKRSVFCSHDIAAYHKVSQYYTHAPKGQNSLVPTTNNPFPPPSQSFINIYKKLTRQTCMHIYTQRKRPINEAEIEQILCNYIQVRGTETAFGDSKLAERNWD